MAASVPPQHSVWLDLDSAWESSGAEALRRLNVQSWGKSLRYCAPSWRVEAFYEEVKDRLKPFVLYGSGDFHFLSALWIRRIQEPFILISFDNHPDWDIRPPRWSCGGWINRALENSRLRKAAVWGCGNFELEWPSRWFANRRAVSIGRLEVYPWKKRLSPGTQSAWRCLARETWREDFQEFLEKHAGTGVYVTVDLDCLAREHAATNWENGLFGVEDLAWALQAIHAQARVLGGDLCGAYSRPDYARWLQGLAGRWDHPTQPPVEETEARRMNSQTFQKIWPALAGGSN